MGFGTIMYLFLGTAERQNWACDIIDEPELMTDPISTNLDQGSINIFNGNANE